MQKTNSLPLLLALSVGAAACSGPSVSVTPRYGENTIKGSVSANTTGASLYNNLNSDLGLDKDGGRPGARVDFDWSGLHLLFSADRSTFSGSGTLANEITVGDVTIPGGEAVDTDLEVGIAQGVFTWDFIPGQMIDLGIGAGIAGVGWDTTITSSTFGTGTNAQTIPIPVLAARAKFQFWRAMVSGDLGWMDVSYNGDNIGYTDLDLLAGIRLFGRPEGFRVLLNGGYRITSLNGGYDDGDSQVDFDSEISGWYGGLTFAF